MNKLLVFFWAGSILTLMVQGCKKDSSTDQLALDFNGKYMIVSASADRKVDVNLDGIANIDMLQEIADLKGSYLELIIREDSEQYVFAQSWQNQYFQSETGSTPTAYDPNVIVNYVNQATVSTFKFNQDKSELILTRDNLDPLFPLPESVEILPSREIRIRMTKSLYTSSGWQKASIVVIYRLFSEQF